MRKILFCLIFILFLGVKTPLFAEENYEQYIDKAVEDIQRNDIKSAKENFNKAVLLNEELKNSPEILYYYAKLCLLNNNYKEALDNILKAIELNGDEPLYYLELGKIYYDKKDYLKAINAFEYSLGNDVEINAKAYNYIGLSNYKRGNLKTALDNFQKAVEIKTTITYLNNLALCYKSLGEEDKSKETYKKIESYIPQEAFEYYELSQIFYDRKDFKNAKKILEAGLLKYPNDPVLKNAFNKLNKS